MTANWVSCFAGMINKGGCRSTHGRMVECRIYIFVYIFVTRINLHCFAVAGSSLKRKTQHINTNLCSHHVSKSIHVWSNIAVIAVFHRLHLQWCLEPWTHAAEGVTSLFTHCGLHSQHSFTSCPVFALVSFYSSFLTMSHRIFILKLGENPPNNKSGFNDLAWNAGYGTGHWRCGDVSTEAPYADLNM